MTDKLTVTDADRKAYLSLNMLDAIDRAFVMDGQWDKTTGVQALVRHRALGRLQGLEEAAGVIERDNFVTGMYSLQISQFKSVGDWLTAIKVAAIRALKG